MKLLTEADFQEFQDKFPRSQLTSHAESLCHQNRLSFDEGVDLLKTNELAALCWLGGRARHNLHGKTTWFCVNRHINYSNLCTEICLFCSFSRDVLTKDNAYEMDLDTILNRAKELEEMGAKELHIVGGNHPSLPWEYYLDVISAIHKNHPSVGIKAFTAVEIWHFHKRFNKSVDQVLTELKNVGLSSLPGGGAEIFAERVRKKICRTKATAEQWLSVHKTAHALNIPTNATLLFGTVETYEERIDHLQRLRSLQDETNGFTAFIPLAYHPDNNRMEKVGAPGGVDKLKMIAVSRLFLDNFPHIKAYWVMLGTQIASLAQHYGASDLDGTIVEEKIYHMAGAKTPQELAIKKLHSLITSEGFTPRERNNIYQEVNA